MSDVELRLQDIAPPANLVDVVAGYYRWNSKSPPTINAEFAKADTASGTEVSAFVWGRRNHNPWWFRQFRQQSRRLGSGLVPYSYSNSVALAGL